MCATIVGLGLFFLILNHTKIGKKFFEVEKKQKKNMNTSLYIE